MESGSVRNLQSRSRSMRSEATRPVRVPRRTIAHDTIRRRDLLLYEDDMTQATQLECNHRRTVPDYLTVPIPIPNPPKVGGLENSAGKCCCLRLRLSPAMREPAQATVLPHRLTAQRRFVSNLSSSMDLTSITGIGSKKVCAGLRLLKSMVHRRNCRSCSVCDLDHKMPVFLGIPSAQRTPKRFTNCMKCRGPMAA